jgi:HK97 family phage major capsid protein
MSGVPNVNEQIKHAYDEYRKAVEAEKALSAEIVGRAPTAEEQEKFERMEADIASWKHEVERLLKVAERSKEVDALRTEFAALFEQSDETERKPAAKRDIEVLADMFAKARAGQHVVAEEDDESNPFRVRAPFVASLANRQTRALASSGGTAIDQTFVEQVLFYEVDESPMLDPSVVQVIVTPRGEPMDFPRLTADPNVAGTLTAEAGGLTAADPTLSKVTLNAFKYGGITLWSAELDQDDVIAIQDVIARSAARHIAEQVNNPLTVGDGNSKPNGIISAAANGGTASGTSSANVYFGPNDLIDLFYGRKAAYRRRGNWLANATTLAQIRKLEDGQGMKIWQPSLAPGQPETVLGRPIFENPDMASGSAAKAVLFGDTQRYIVRRAGSLRVEVSRDYKFDTDQLALKAVERIDGDLLDANAVAFLVNAAV